MSILNTLKPPQHNNKPIEKTKIFKSKCVKIFVKRDQSLEIKLFDISIQEIIGCFEIASAQFCGINPSFQTDEVSGINSTKEVQLNFSTREV